MKLERMGWIKSMPRLSWEATAPAAISSASAIGFVSTTGKSRKGDRGNRGNQASQVKRSHRIESLFPARVELVMVEDSLFECMVHRITLMPTAQAQMKPHMYGTRPRHHLPLALPYSQLFISVSLHKFSMQARVAGGSLKE